MSIRRAPAFEVEPRPPNEFGADNVEYVLTRHAVQRLTLAVQRARQRADVAPAALDALLRELAGLAAAPRRLRWLRAALGNEVRLIAVDEVLYFQADIKYTRVVTADGEALIRTPLKELQANLDPACFWAIHRSTIVNARAIGGAMRDARGHLTVRLRARAETLAVSAAHEHLFKQM